LLVVVVVEMDEAAVEAQVACLQVWFLLRLVFLTR
jgi:hypothetical protein